MLVNYGDTTQDLIISTSPSGYGLDIKSVQKEGETSVILFRDENTDYVKLGWDGSISILAPPRKAAWFVYELLRHRNEEITFVAGGHSLTFGPNGIKWTGNKEQFAPLAEHFEDFKKLEVMR